MSFQSTQNIILNAGHWISARSDQTTHALTLLWHQAKNWRPIFESARNGLEWTVGWLESPVGLPHPRTFAAAGRAVQWGQARPPFHSTTPQTHKYTQHSRLFATPAPPKTLTVPFSFSHCRFQKRRDHFLWVFFMGGRTEVFGRILRWWAGKNTTKLAITHRRSENDALSYSNLLRRGLTGWVPTDLAKAQPPILPPVDGWPQPQFPANIVARGDCVETSVFLCFSFYWLLRGSHIWRDVVSGWVCFVTFAVDWVILYSRHKIQFNLFGDITGRSAAQGGLF